MYEASVGGGIRQIISDEPVNSRDHAGYDIVRVKNAHGTKSMGVHRLVCEAFHGQKPTPKHMTAHWDGNKKNNRPSNLRWATASENQADRVRHEASKRVIRNRPDYFKSQQKNLPASNS